MSAVWLAGSRLSFSFALLFSSLFCFFSFYLSSLLFSSSLLLFGFSCPSSLLLFLFPVLLFLLFVYGFSSTSSPGGNQVDGLPPVFTYWFSSVGRPAAAAKIGDF